jgi:enterochelin esterase-like enzyme
VAGVVTMGNLIGVGQLDVTGWGFLTGLAGLVLVMWWRAIGRRKGVGVKGIGVKRIRPAALAGALVLTVLLAADGVNSYFSDLPHVADLVSVVTGYDTWTQIGADDLQPTGYLTAIREAPHGGLARLHVPDRGSGFGASTALVYLPPQYFTDPGRRFPVVYLLHGSPGTPADWVRGGGAARTGAALAAAGQPTLIVIPRMSHHWLDDSECVDGVKLHAETHLLGDVLPTADSTYRTLPTPGGRIIAGMSAGGFCALNLGLRHPDVFGTIIDMSGLDRPTHSGGTAALFGPGPLGRLGEAANDPSQYAARLPIGLPTRVWLDSGRADREVLPGMGRMYKTLQGRQITVRLTTRSGSHTYKVWRPALRQALQWAVSRQSST